MKCIKIFYQIMYYSLQASIVNILEVVEMLEVSPTTEITLINSTTTYSIIAFINSGRGVEVM